MFNFTALFTQSCFPLYSHFYYFHPHISGKSLRVTLSKSMIPYGLCFDFSLFTPGKLRS